MRTNVTLPLAIAAATCVGVVAAVVSSGTDDRARAGSARVHAAVSAPSAVPSVLSRYAVFQRPAPSAGTNPFERIAAYTSVDAASARPIASADGQVWAAFGADKVCVQAKSNLEPAGSPGACAPLQSFRAGESLIGWSRPSPAAAASAGVSSSTAEVYALVPDGVDHVDFTLTDGTDTTLEAYANGVFGQLPHPPVEQRFTDASGTHHVQRLTRPVEKGAQP